MRSLTNILCKDGVLATHLEYRNSPVFHRIRWWQSLMSLAPSVTRIDMVGEIGQPSILSRVRNTAGPPPKSGVHTKLFT